MNASTPEKGYTRKDWQRHYQSGDLGWDLGAVAPLWVRLWEEKVLVPGQTLVPGCGRGHEVLFLAEQGFQVTAVDYAPEAVDHLQKVLNDTDLPCRVLNLDFFELDSSHTHCYDLMVEQTFFCAIAPSLRPRYVETASRVLKPDGLLAALFYETGEKGGPPFNTTREDILHHFSGRFETLRLEKTPHSVERRKGKEWLALLRKV